MFYQEKQPSNQGKTTRKFERNEELRERFPPFRSSSNNTIIHVHYLTPIETINDLLEKARTTTLYAVDTESQVIQGQRYGGIIQIQFIHSKNSSTITLIEAQFLPNKNSILFFKIKQLCEMIFNGKNRIFSWGETKKEFDDFHDYELFEPSNPFKGINLQLLFQKWHNNQVKSNTHPPPGERRVNITGCYVTPGEKEEIAQGICTCGHLSHEDGTATWSLQDAIADATRKFLDKTESRGKWTCGLDFELNTWRRRLFSKAEYNQQEEKNKRLAMIHYASTDCLAVAELYFIMYPTAMNNNEEIFQTPPPSTTTTTKKRNTTTSNLLKSQVGNYYHEDIMDISDDDEIIGVLSRKEPKKKSLTTAQNNKNELDQIKFPHFHEQTKTTQVAAEDEASNSYENELNIIKFPYFEKQATHENNYELITEVTNEENDELIERIHEQKQSSSSWKSRKQRRKNDKLKMKQKTRADFQNFLRRPIYRQYDFLKIKSQLEDDDIHTSHQITINKDRLEVKIGFKSGKQLEEARRKIKSNYFSRDQFMKRWG